ncbi:PE family protein [Mycobacterium kansasii 732]|nr:PE family protein [Mycobacterium kansasii 732]
MSLVILAPQIMAAAALDMAIIGSTISEANAAAAVPTMGLLAAAEDEVSAAIAALFDSYAREYQALSAQMSTFHDQVVGALTAGAASYASAEAANMLPMEELLNLVNAPTQLLLGRPLIGDGADGNAANPNGQAGDCCSAMAATGTTATAPGWPAALAVTPGCGATVASAVPVGRARPADPAVTAGCCMATALPAATVGPV